MELMFTCVRQMVRLMRLHQLQPLLLNLQRVDRL